MVKTARDVTTRVLFLFVILTSLGSKSKTPFYLNRRKRQHYYDAAERESAGNVQSCGAAIAVRPTWPVCAVAPVLPNFRYVRNAGFVE